MYHIITIERRYASGGHEIGKRLAEALGYKLYDRNILLEAAQRLDIPFFKIESLEESSSGNILMNLSKTPLGGLAGNKDLPLADKLFLEEKQIIEKAAEDGNCVIVGRASGYILREKENILRVFVYADHEKRIQRAIEREGIQKEEAENALKKNDKRRKNFYNSFTSHEWGDPKYYDMYLNAGKLGIDLCLKLLMEATKG
ncbi:cytidylate kinase-like family protein [Parablautia muri]|uniref:Cytidylate kinase-like family protein n=1 Tax=Parablautia muri TaxID=2320879 RepID=A0A9X5GSQ3_9FIRM|nr:cytidylate kinase-like family protein [Parablautia muri]NBJ93145.1 cytidylate kinase-like family protein [Parablautia muri]